MMQSARSVPRRRLFGEGDRSAEGVSADRLVLLVCVWFVATGNGAFWRALLEGRELGDAQTWWMVTATGAALVALHYLVIAPLANRWTVRPLLSLLIVVAAFAGHFIDRYGVYLDPGMLRNVLRTDVKEARELFAWAMLPHLALHAALPLWLLWRVRPARRRWLASLPRRLGMALLVAAVGAGALLSVFQDAAATVRNHKELRYLITPGNLVWSLATVLAQDSRSAVRPRHAIGTDAARTAAARVDGRRPLRVVMVVGETARAANWGLNGYARQTTPLLAAMPDLVSYAQVTSCGTNTEVSLPCMFSPGGRRDYDEARIRGSESLLHVLQRAGVQVLWRDNQSGCKGVCDGVPNELVGKAMAPALCAGERCLDEALLAGLGARLASVAGATGADQFVVLHQLGNHGPAYDRRYPDAFRRFTPVCETADLRRCSREQIVNAYDNALLYTDQVLARAIDWLRQDSAGRDTALLYVSDHGESLGENGLYLHGVPYAIAPDVQTQVPMLLWLSAGIERSQGIDAACMRQRAAQPATHDHLFHTLLGLMEVSTAIYDLQFDLLGACRRGR